jgi:2-polyprenyl-6-methoxyphenol hydroxylase-like FAD-dependent oxidoreductase
MQPTLSVPVLIVGGGPVGLAASILLSRHGVGSLLVERNPTTAQHPKATVVNARSMELFRQWGIEAQVRAQGVPQEPMLYMRWVRSLAGEELARYSLSAEPARLLTRLGAGPAMPVICPQDIVEPLLLERARSSPHAAIRFASELVGFAQDEAGVTATLRDAKGATEQVRAQYMLAADGAASRTREQLGIAMIGPKGLGDVVNIYFAADLKQLAAARPAFLYWLVSAQANGVLIALDGRRRWLLNLPLQPGESAGSYTSERSEELVRAAVGLPGLAVEIRGVSPWRAHAQVAERYRAGRVLLVGDAAHRFPPTAGFGMNTGLQDAHNLIWKLVAVMEGSAAPGLLDTYETERRPVAQSNADLSAANFLRLGSAGIGPEGADLVRGLEAGGQAAAAARATIAAMALEQGGHFDFSGQELGFSYASAAVIPDGSPAPRPANPVRDYIPTARPGARAPHRWLRHRGQVVSSLDLFAGLTLIVGEDGADWERAARQLGARRGLSLAIYRLGADLTDASALDQSRQRLAGSGGLSLRARLGLLWGVLREVGPGGLRAMNSGSLRESYALGPQGAVLVRPDGHVAWRAAGRAADPAATLAHVYEALLGAPAPWASSPHSSAPPPARP